MIQMSEKASKVFKALEEDPSKMNSILKGNESKVIRGVLGNDASEEEISAVTKEVNNNNVMKLFLGANGQIDAEDLMKVVGGFSSDSTRANPTKASGIAALLDGKLDVNDLLAITGLLGGGVSSNNLLSGLTSNNTAKPSNSMNLFSALLGGGQQQKPQNNSLFSGLFSQPQQQQTQQNPTSILINSLLGGGQQQQQTQQNPLAALFGQPQQQVQQNPLGALFGQPQQQQQVQQNPLGALFGQQQPQQQVQQNPLGALFGQQQPQQQQGVDASALLNALFGGQAQSGGAQNSQYPNQAFGIAQNNNAKPAQNAKPQSKPASNTVSASDIFSIVNSLLGNK